MGQKAGTWAWMAMFGMWGVMKGVWHIKWVKQGLKQALVIVGQGG